MIRQQLRCHRGLDDGLVIVYHWALLLSTNINRFLVLTKSFYPQREAKKHKDKDAFLFYCTQAFCEKQMKCIIILLFRNT